MMRQEILLMSVALSFFCANAFADPASAAVLANSKTGAGTPAQATPDYASLQREIEHLKRQVKQLQPDITEAMLGLQIRHARLWFAGEAGDWELAAFQVHGLKDGLEGIVDIYPEHAALQPERLGDILPAMMGAPMKTLRTAVDNKNKAEFEHAFDGVSAACTGCHTVAGFTFLQIHRPKMSLLDNLSGAPVVTSMAK
jgi:hypothetical protein